MRKLVFILALIAAFAFDLPMDKTPCMKPPPVCFNSAMPNSSYCSDHQNLPPGIPPPKQCVFIIIAGGGGIQCQADALPGKDYCSNHNWPDLSERSTCVAAVVPVCFNPAMSGSSFCSSHQPVPPPKLCPYPTPTGPCNKPASPNSMFCSNPYHSLAVADK